MGWGRGRGGGRRGKSSKAGFKLTASINRGAFEKVGGEVRDVCGGAPASPVGGGRGQRGGTADKCIH